MNGWQALTLILFAYYALQVSGSAMSQENVVSDLKSDERVVFFTTDARLSEDQKTWLVPIHAWVHELESATARKAAVAAALSLKYGLTTSDDTAANFDRRVRLIMADNERGKMIVITIAGQTLSLPRTQPNGHASGEFQLDAESVSQLASNGRLVYSAVLRKDDDRKFTGSVNLIPPTGLSVISDFDDTVKLTHVTDRTKMFERSLFLDYQEIPGMSQLYSSWANQGVAIHFVSSSPWHLYEPIDEFLDANKFPARSMSLKHFRFRDSTLLNLFKKGAETKPAQIVPIINAYPGRRFILIGDSGEQDPEVYAQMLKQFPKQIERICIRNVTAAKRSDARFSKVFAGIEPEKWILFDDPKLLELP